MFKVKLARNRDRPVFEAETEENRRGSSIGMVPSFYTTPAGDLVTDMDFQYPWSFGDKSDSERGNCKVKKMFAVVSVVLLVCLFAGAAFAHGHEKEQKNGILMVAFGTSVPEARVAIDNMVTAASKAFPDVEVRLSFTSNIIRRKIAKEQGIQIDTPLTALAKMQDEGFTNVVVQPTHVMPGEEYNEIAEVVAALQTVPGKYGFSRLVLGIPLLNTVDDYKAMAGILHRAYGKHTRNRGAVVLMGHGTPHPANSTYSQLQMVLNKYAPRFVVGTVEGFPELEDVQNRLSHMNASRITLVPCMIVAGDHAMNDMAGADDPESWINILKADGYKTGAVLKGLGELEEVPLLMVEHLRASAREAFE
jgi:sirohydrochlorin cobaltochelatase